MIKERIFEESNYKAIWFGGRTIRLCIDGSKDISELEYPEFYDVKITGHCEGECPWCYMDSKKTDLHYHDILGKINRYFGSMTENQRPFQVAIGGGEPTSHPYFCECLKTFSDLGIVPNYTTNGMFCKETYYREILNATKQYSGGVAVSCHPHLDDYWRGAALMYGIYGIKLNFHIIISDKESIDRFVRIYEDWNPYVEYFVLLPYGVQGRAENKAIDYEYLSKVLPQSKQIAFGANFYHFLKGGDHNIDVSLYEPELMSKFLDMKDMKLYKSSFNLVEVCCV